MFYLLIYFSNPSLTLYEEVHKRYCYVIEVVIIDAQYFRPQETIATALMLCHRFYLRQSLAKNDWQVQFIIEVLILSSLFSVV